MSGLAITLALLAALAAAGWRLLRRQRLRLRLAALPAGSTETAMGVSSFSEIDEEIRRRRCLCGGRLDVIGEGSEVDGERRLRRITVECRHCERRDPLYFDVTSMFH